MLSTHMRLLYRTMYVCICCTTDTIRNTASSQASRRTSWSIRCISLISKVNLIVILRWLLLAWYNLWHRSIASYKGGSTINSQPLHPFLLLPFWLVFILTCWALISSYAIIRVLASYFFTSLLILDCLPHHTLGFWVLEVADRSSIFRTYRSVRINAYSTAWGEHWTRQRSSSSISPHIGHLPIIETWLNLARSSSLIRKALLHLLFSHVAACSSSHESAWDLSTIVMSMVILSWWCSKLVTWSYTCWRLLTTKVSVRWLITLRCWAITVSARACW